MRESKHTPWSYDHEGYIETCLAAKTKENAALLARVAEMEEALRFAQAMILNHFTKEVRDAIPTWYDVEKKISTALARKEGP